MAKHKLSQLPKMDRLLAREELAGCGLPYPLVRRAARQALEEARQGLLAGSRDRAPTEAEAAARTLALARALSRPGLVRVINATGVPLHTNLGRSPLSPRAAQAVQEAAAGYCCLEYDLASGRRGSRTGRVEELIPVPWYLVEPWKDVGGRIWYTVTHPLTGEPMVLPQEDICHYKGATRDGLKGISPLRRAADTLAEARAAQEYNRAFYENGGQPSGVLQTDSDLGGYLTGPDGKPMKRPDGSLVTKKEALRADWEKVHAGPSNSHRLAILDLGLKYTPIAASNQEAQFIENKEVSIRDIARYFGIPLYKLGEGKESYSSNEQNAIEYVVGTLHPIVTQYEEEQTWKLLTDRELAAGLEIRINLMAELRGDTEARGRWYQIMLQEGPFSVNDVRALEDLPDIPGGDFHRASLNYVPLEEWAELSRIRAESRVPAE